MKNVKQANLNVTLKKLFRYWLQITKLFHKLTKQQQDVLSLFLYYHYVYKTQITNDKILWKTVFDYDTRLLISKELNVKEYTIENILTILRKKKIIINNTINSMYIPDLDKDSKNFKIIFNFNIVDD